MNTIATILLIMVCNACAQTRPLQPKTTHPKVGPKDEKMLTEGIACKSPHASWSSDSDSYARVNLDGTWYRYPSNDIWDCVNGKWHHDVAAEDKRAARVLAVSIVAGHVITQKLTADEMEYLESALAPPEHPSGMMFSCGRGVSCGRGESDQAIRQYSCERESIKTSNLIAQLGFWNPPEKELPLKMLESYVKGMNCDAGTMRAYEIMNARIVAWLWRATGAMNSRSHYVETFDAPPVK